MVSKSNKGKITMANKNTFANGIYFKKPTHGAPDFVIGKISIKTDAFISFLQSQGGEWLNLDVKNSKDDKTYIVVNDWKPNNQQAAPAQVDFNADSFLNNNDNSPF